MKNRTSRRHQTIGYTVEGRKIQLRERNSITDFLCIVPALVLLIVLNYYPIMSLVRISFTDWNLLKPSYSYVGFKNWAWLFTGSGGKAFWASMRVTAIFTVGNITLTLGLGILLALLFNKMSRTYSIMRAIVFMPRYIAMSTAGIVFLWMMNKDFGILNAMLKWFGLAPVNWIGQRNNAMWSILILSVWHGVGYSMMIYLSAMLGISKDYYEAASLDGANGRQVFLHITMPLLSPTTLFLLITTFLSSMKVYQSVDVLTGGGPYGATEVFVYLIYRLAFTDFRIDRASVIALVFFVILLVITALTMRITNRNVHYDA